MMTLAQRLESSLLPLPDTLEWRRGRIIKREWTTVEKVLGVAKQILVFAVSVVSLTLAIAFNLACRVFSLSSPAKEKQKAAFLEADLARVLPRDFGFADSMFQTSGLGTSRSPTPLSGRSNWDKMLTPEHIEGPPNYKEYFVDILQNPQPFIEILKKMHVTAHRFSLEWSVIEPEPGKIDPEAVRLYRRLIQELKKEGIEPYVTLHHFVQPEWFGDFEDVSKIAPFIRHSLRMMETFPEVTNWITFNEPGIYAFSARMRGAFPPCKIGDFKGTANTLRNMLIAHSHIYKAAKEKFGDKVQIGVAHQWLNFVPLEENPNVFERFLCYTLSKITHYSVYNFFKTGHFDFEIPAMANVHFSIPEKEFQENRGFLDFIGVQFYGYPRFKIGLNGGEVYPGYKTVNIPLWGNGLTIGSTCRRGEKMMSLGTSVHPEPLEDCLTEAAALKKPIAITEIGCDSKIQKWGDKMFRSDEATQREYFLKIAPILDRFKHQMKALFVWTLFLGHLEWERGDFPALGVMKLEKDHARRIIGAELSPAGALLQKTFQEKKALKIL